MIKFLIQNLIKSLINCPEANKSTGEEIIKIFLDSNNIEYLQQYGFVGCKDKNKLRFDFFLPKSNTLIEFDGIQHSHPVERFGGIEGFNDNKRRDEIKNSYAKNNGINIIRINYLDNINEILTFKNQLNEL